MRQKRGPVIIGGRAHNPEEIELIAKAGLPFAEISLRDPTVFQQESALLKQLKDTYGLYYLAHGPEEENPWDLASLQKKFLPLVLSLLDYAGELAIAVFTVHFWLDHRFVDKNIVKAKIAILQEITSHAADHGIMLCIENLSESFVDFSIAFDSIAALKMTLDVGHGELLTKKNTSYDFSRHCLEKIEHIHLHDNRGGNTPADDLHLPLGEGIIDFPAILGTLKERGYQKTMTLEVKSQYLLNGKQMIEEIWYSKT